MANLYTQELLEEGPERARCEFSLFSLLTSSDEKLMVNGARILREGSTEWNEYLANLRKRLEKAHAPSSKVEERIESIKSDKYIVDYVPFSAGHYKDKRLIYNQDGGVIGEIAVPRKQIDFFQLPYRPLDWARKAGGEKSYFYAGTSNEDLLHEALKEFEQEGFTFNLFDTPWYGHYIVNGERTKALSVKPIERVSIDQVVNLQYKRLVNV